MSHLKPLIYGLFLSLVSANTFAANELPGNLEGVQNGQQIFLDIEDGAHRTMFKDPGHDWSCPAEECPRVTWPSRENSLFYGGKVKEVDTFNPITQKTEKIFYIYVLEKLGEPKNGKTQLSGWMMADTFKAKVYSPAFRKTAKKPTGPCPPAQAEQNYITDKLQGNVNQEVARIFSKLSGVVGQCPSRDPAHMKVDFRAKENPFDQVILPMLMKTQFPDLKKDNGRSVSREEIYAIDAHARTCIAEIGTRCATSGPEYVFAWERMALNRAEYVERKTSYASRFVMTSHPSEDNAKTQVVVEPSQYDVWKQGGSVGNAFCPASNSQKPMFTGQKTSRRPFPIETEGWNTCLKAAIEGVLYPQEFKDVRTRGFQETSYRTGDAYTRLKDVKNAKVLGRPLSNHSCMRVLHDETLPKLSDL